MASNNLSYLYERRKAVQAAISEVLSAGQSMSLDDGISYSRANLSRLYEMERHINNQIARATGARPLFQGVKMKGLY